jgi:hypothetical protein
LLITLFVWDTRFKGDTFPLSNDVEDQIFRNTQLTSLDGEPEYAFCFGKIKWLQQNHPCVYIVNFSRAGKNASGLFCYNVYYLAEANYGITSSEVPSQRRYYPFEDNPRTVNLCGTFKPQYMAKKRVDGNNYRQWNFDTRDTLNQLIESDLKYRGYVF